MRGTGSERPIGHFAGFKLSVADNFMRGPEIVLKGASTHTAKAANTALGTIRSLEYTVQNLDESAASLTQNIAGAQKRLTDLQDQLDAPFEYTDKLTSLVKRQQQITDALDLNKNQAPNQLDSQTSEAAEEAVQQVEPPSRKMDKLNGQKVKSKNQPETVTPTHQKRPRVRI